MDSMELISMITAIAHAPHVQASTKEIAIRNLLNDNPPEVIKSPQEVSDDICSKADPERGIIPSIKALRAKFPDMTLVNAKAFVETSFRKFFREVISEEPFSSRTWKKRL